MAIQKTDAIILRTQPFRSSSLIVTLFSKEFGKIKGIAKGVRLERELRGSLFELFTMVEVVYYEKQKSDLHLISEAFILENFQALHATLESISYASYFAELVDALTEFHDPHPALFENLAWGLRSIPMLPQERVARVFETKLLAEIGWLPYLEACVQCGNKNIEEPVFSPQQGALYCSGCAKEVKDARPISSETREALQRFILDSPEESSQLALSPQSSRGLEKLMELFLQFRLNRPLKSRIFLQTIQPVLSASSPSVMPPI